jgi:hypothetical protein
MSNASYSFLPWFRRGIGGLGAAPAPGSARANVRVELDLTGERIAAGAPLSARITRDIELYGPGDIVGIDRRVITRIVPRDWITNVEPNYLAHIEFYEEDFPWRYSPQGPFDGNLKLKPWLALVVLEESEFKDGKVIAGRPLSFIEVADFAALPPHAELWAWAHVHVNGSLTANDDEFVSQTMGAVLPKLESILGPDPDLGHSRILCPRKLDPNKAYHAFLVPSYESGRRAGLGLTQQGLPAAGTMAWETYGGRPESQLMPVYHRWYFRTGAGGDFEDLVKLLKPQVVDARVGYRDIDVQAPGSTLPGIAGPDNKGVLKLGGALRAPDSALSAEQKAQRDQFEKWAGSTPHAFQRALAALINLADDYQIKSATAANAAPQLDTSTQSEFGDDEDVSPDPLIVPPLYGRWHAAVDRLLVQRDGTSTVTNSQNWIHELNLDPRYRSAANAGTQVIQKHQEEYMDAAWAQVGDVIEANRKLRWAQFARQISHAWYMRRVVPVAVAQDRFLRLTRPMHRRIMVGSETMRASIARSTITATMLSAAVTRMLRPRGRLMRFAGGVKRDEFLANINAGKIATAHPKRAPQGLISVEEIGTKGVAEALERGGNPAINRVLAQELGKLLASPGAVKFGQLSKPETFSTIDPERKDEHVERTKEEADRMYGAVREWFELMEASEKASAREEPEPVELAALSASSVKALAPLMTIRARALHGLAIPGRITSALEEEFDEIMHHPVIDLPMYKPLEDLSKEFFMPNLALIPQNSVTAVETNQNFIEAYMVGLNHEFSRELLWREYPTDQRGSVFRQFWDVKGLLGPTGMSAEDFRESVRDIPKIHRWPRASKLGTHDNREPTGGQKENIVLVIRGELLKKYPNTVIYAQHAIWQPKQGGGFDATKERLLEPVPAGQEERPPATIAQFPLFEAKVDPDIYFFGFNLTEEDVAGRMDQSAPTPANAGWFFVLKERPGEPRFGFDSKSAEAGKRQTVNDIGWPDIIPEGSTRKFLDPAVTIPTFENLTPSEDEKEQQQIEDKKVFGPPQAAGVSAARWAYLLYQAPVMVAIHGADLVKRK